MLRTLLAVAVVAPALLLPTAADAIKDCESTPCACGTEIAVGLPDKDPIVHLGRVDC